MESIGMPAISARRSVAVAACIVFTKQMDIHISMKLLKVYFPIKFVQIAKYSAVLKL